MKKEVEPQTDNKSADFENNEDFKTVQQVLAEEIAEGQVEVKIEDEKIVVELTSPASSGGEGESDNGTLSAGIIDQKTVEMFAKVADAQAQIESEVVVKDTQAADQMQGQIRVRMQLRVRKVTVKEVRATVSQWMTRSRS